MDTVEVKSREPGSIGLVIGLVLSCGISLKLSTDMFSSIATTVEYGRLYAGIAVALELLKLSLIPEIVKCYRNHNDVGAGALSVLFIALASVSIVGSVAAIERDTMATNAVHSSTMQDREGDQLLLQGLLSEIEMNNQAIAFYQDEKLIELRAAPLRRQNESLREQVSEINTRLRNAPIPEPSRINAISEAVANATGFPADTARVGLFAIFAVLLEIASAYFFFRTSKSYSKFHLLKRSSSKAAEGGIQASGDSEPDSHRKTLTRPEISSQQPLEAPVLNNEITQTTNAAEQQEICDTPQFPKQPADKALPDNVIAIKEARTCEKQSIKDGSEEGCDETNYQSLQSDPDYLKIREVIIDGRKPSKRALMQEYNIGSDRMGVYFTALMHEGVLMMGENKRFQRVVS